MFAAGGLYMFSAVLQDHKVMSPAVASSPQVLFGVHAKHTQHAPSVTWTTKCFGASSSAAVQQAAAYAAACYFDPELLCYLHIIASASS